MANSLRNIVEKTVWVFGLFGAMYSGFLPLDMALFCPLADIVEMQLMVLICHVLLNCSVS